MQMLSGILDGCRLDELAPWVDQINKIDVKKVSQKKKTTLAFSIKCINFSLFLNLELIV